MRACVRACVGMDMYVCMCPCVCVCEGRGGGCTPVRACVPMIAL